MNTAALWRSTLERLEETPIDEVSKAWLQSAHLADASHIGADDIDASLSPQDQALYFMLQVAGNLARDVISTRWRRSIEDVLMDITGQPVAISVTNGADDGYSDVDGLAHNGTPGNNREAGGQQHSAMGMGSLEAMEEWDNEQRANILMHNRLNPRYTFDAFIVGGSNRLAQPLRTT